MRKSIILLLMSNVCCTMGMLAQEPTTTQDLLMSTTWEPQDLYYEGDCGYLKYTKRQDIYVEKIDNIIDRVSSSYYLSSSPDSVFDTSKVGQNKNGRYIIRKGAGYVFISEILELNPTKLVIRNLTPGFTTTGKKTTYLPAKMNF